jgi:hypothetical protein
MKDDVRKYIYGAITVFLLGVTTWLSIVYVSACGVTLSCNRAAFKVDRTPIPTLIPATLPAPTNVSFPEAVIPSRNSCRITAADFIGAWVSANSPEANPFYFVDVDGKNCEATFADIQPLFTESNFWHSNSLSCVSCHSGDMTVSLAQLDLSSYAGIMIGSRRVDDKSKGIDILGGGDWEKSLLYDFLTSSKAGIPGHEQAMIVDPFVFAGKPFAGPLPTPAPTVTPKP